MPSFFSSLLILSSALLAHADIDQTDFTGLGRIFVLKSNDWRTASPDSKVGCLNERGRFVGLKGECGVFSRMNDWPYTVSSKHGNCTFEDTKQERNTDSHYGGNDYAFSCVDYTAEIYDQLYTLDGFPYVFLCFGDVACYYDAKRVPKDNEDISLWQYHWGSQQMGITPGHTQMQLLWEKVGDTPKREGASHIPGSRIQIQEGRQVPLPGSRARG